MNLQPAFNKFEMRFWKFVIPLMQNSPWVKRIMSGIYQGVATRLNKRTALVLGACIFAGGSLGFLVGMISQLR